MVIISPWTVHYFATKQALEKYFVCKYFPYVYGET